MALRNNNLKIFLLIIVFSLGVSNSLSSQTRDDYHNYSAWRSELDRAQLAQSRAQTAYNINLIVGPIATLIFARLEMPEAAVGTFVIAFSASVKFARDRNKARAQVANLTMEGQRNDWLHGYNPSVSNKSTPPDSTDSLSLEERLLLLRDLLDNGLITEEEFEKLRKELLRNY